MRINDKMRLDWLEANSSDIQADGRSTEEKWCITHHERSACGWYPDLRKAIDAAMKAERKSK